MFRLLGLPLNGGKSNGISRWKGGSDLEDYQIKGKDLKKDENNLRGTFTGVLLIGAFIAIVWFSMFYVFVTRQ